MALSSTSDAEAPAPEALAPEDALIILSLRNTVLFPQTVLPITIQGDAAGIDSVSVSLVNSQGSSSAVSGKF